ncbi:MAG TPA: hypothetical protein VE077_21660 [Candidatus Methylomirabilis sp.]|nr:hypothetical protein [Candidatus Methylomirabilis sp.]
MAKFGLFGGNFEEPLQTYEGERMIWDAGKEYVQIISGSLKGGGEVRTVAVVRLDRGQSMKEIQ